MDSRRDRKQARLWAAKIGLCFGSTAAADRLADRISQPDQPTGSASLIHLPMSLYKLCSFNICMSASFCHPKTNKLLETFLCLLLYLAKIAYAVNNKSYEKRLIGLFNKPALVTREFIKNIAASKLTEIWAKIFFSCFLSSPIIKWLV